MIDFVYINLKDHYDKMYSKPNTDTEAISLLIHVFEEEMGHMTPSVKSGLSEVYRELMGKGLPAYYWILEAIHRTSKKKESKKTFPYIVGTLRNWSLYGFGNTLTDEEEEIFDYFSETAGLNVTPESRLIISSLMGQFGAFKLMRCIPDLKEIDQSLIMANMLARIMKEKYSPEEPSLLQIKNDKTHIALPSSGDQNKNKISNEERIRVAKIVSNFLKNSKSPVRATHVADYLISKKVEWITKDNVHGKIESFMIREKKIVKVGKGQYWHSDNTKN